MEYTNQRSCARVFSPSAAILENEKTLGTRLAKIFKMAVNGRNFNRVLERVCDISTIPSLYSEQKKKCLEALFEGKDVYASLPTGYGESLNLLCIPNRRL